MNEEQPFVKYDLADVKRGTPKYTARARADYMLGRMSAFQRTHSGHITVLLSPELGDVAEVIKSITMRDFVTVEVTARLHRCESGLQGAT